MKVTFKFCTYDSAGSKLVSINKSNIVNNVKRLPLIGETLTLARKNEFTFKGTVKSIHTEYKPYNCLGPFSYGFTEEEYTVYINTGE